MHVIKIDCVRYLEYIEKMNNFTSFNVIKSVPIIKNKK